MSPLPRLPILIQVKPLGMEVEVAMEVVVEVEVRPMCPVEQLTQ
jgi:hypothetical protein